MARIELYTTRWCGYCVRAKALLEGRGIAYEEISLDDDPVLSPTVHDKDRRLDGPADPDRRPANRGYVEPGRLDREGGLDELAEAA